MSQLYVAYWCERMRDGIEEAAQIVASIEAGLLLINTLANGFAGTNMEFRLFELGEEIPIESVNKIEPMTPVETVVFSVRGPGTAAVRRKKRLGRK